MEINIKEIARRYETRAPKTQDNAITNFLETAKKTFVR